MWSAGSLERGSPSQLAEGREGHRRGAHLGRQPLSTTKRDGRGSQSWLDSSVQDECMSLTSNTGAMALLFVGREPGRTTTAVGQLELTPPPPAGRPPHRPDGRSLDGALTRAHTIGHGSRRRPGWTQQTRRRRQTLHTGTRTRMKEATVGELDTLQLHADRHCPASPSTGCRALTSGIVGNLDGHDRRMGCGGGVDVWEGGWGSEPPTQRLGRRPELALALRQRDHRWRSTSQSTQSARLPNSRRGLGSEISIDTEL